VHGPASIGVATRDLDYQRGDHLGIKLVVEAMEFAEQVAMLQAMGCDLAQGYCFSPADEPAAIEAFISRHLKSAMAA
jgi:EAL domain-containing protein (putative c-di-GMP-specific phosphodiesterase class I)